MDKKLLIILFLVSSVFLTGCAGNKILLKKKNKDLTFKPNEGGILFSLKIKGPKENFFKPYNVRIQEVNQYKKFKKRRVQIIPLPKYSYDKVRDIYLYSLKLPKGTYNMIGFLGFQGGFWGSQQLIGFNKLFDIKANQINYVGRLEMFFIKEDRRYNGIIKLNNLYNKDVPLFKIKYPVLQGKNIKKNIIY